MGDRELSDALAEGWGMGMAAVRYAPVGGGSYHWIVRDRAGRAWFATVDDLDQKPWLGKTRDAAAEGLSRAMELVVALRYEAGLPFVLAPVPARNGAAIVRLGCAYAVTVFPYLRGATGRFGQELPQPERNQLVDMLAALHSADPGAAGAPRHEIALARRSDLEAAVSQLGQPWDGGPLSEPARALLKAHAEKVGHLLARFDRLTGRVTALDPVITHGEPHPANVLTAALTREGDPPNPPRTETLLIDWDTVALAPPERDLWWIISDSSGEEARRYSHATRRPVDPAALVLYRLRWALDDLSIFTGRLRSAHTRTADAENALRALEITLAGAPG